MSHSIGPLPPDADAEPLHPVLKAEAEARRARPPYRALGVAEVRRMFREAQMAGTPGPEMHAVEDAVIDGPAGPLRVRIYRPTTRELPPLLIYFHGGGFVIGDLDTHDRNARGVAAATSATTMSVDYRLGPEDPFPAAPDDAIRVVSDARKHALAFGADPDRIFIGGDSAGAALALVAALACRDRSGPELAGIVAVYPGTDSGNAVPTASALAFGSGGHGLSSDDIAWFAEAYAPDPAIAADWRRSPARAESLAGLPPTLIIAAAYDALRDEAIAFAQRLEEAGVTVTLHLAPGVNHGFMGAPMPIPATAETLRLIGDWSRTI